MLRTILSPRMAKSTGLTRLPVMSSVHAFICLARPERISTSPVMASRSAGMSLVARPVRPGP